MDDEWGHPLAKSLPSLISNLWWNIIMDNWKLDEKSLDKWQYLQNYKSIPSPPQQNFKEWRINVGLAFSVGNTTPQLTISLEQDD